MWGALIPVLLFVFLFLCRRDARAEDGPPPQAPAGLVPPRAAERADAWHGSDLAPLRAVMRRAERGEALTLALIGGSITMGTVSRGGRDGAFPLRLPYAAYFEKWWRERFPRARLTFVNAGIGGTDSYLGVHRLGRDVLDREPDLVLVEYSVNDEPTAFYAASYDSLVRHVLAAPSRPAPMLLYMGQTNGSTAKQVHSAVGRAYRIPAVSCADVFGALISEGVFTAEELSGDVVHPSALGHAVTGEILCRFLDGVFAERYAPEEDDSPVPPPGEDRYPGASVLTNASVLPESLGSFVPGSGNGFYPDGWTCREGGEEIVFRISFRSLGILYLRTVDGESGKCTVLVDGRPAGTLDADFSGGWGDAVTAGEVFRGDAAEEHVCALRPEGKGKFVLLGLLVSR